MTKRIVLIGLNPDVVDYNNWPGLTPENLMWEFKTIERNLISLGSDVQLYLVDLVRQQRKLSLVN